MKRVCLLAIGLFWLFVSGGCLETVDVETQVRRDGSVVRTLEFVVDDPENKGQLTDVYALPKPPQWRVRTFVKPDGEGKTFYHYLASRTFAASAQKHTDFVIRPFKPRSPLGRFEGKNQWRITRRRGLFHTTYTYEERLHFPRLKEAYVQVWSRAIGDRLKRQLPVTDAEQEQLSAAVRRAVERAVDGWVPVGKHADIAQVVADALTPRLQRIQPRGGKARKWSPAWLEKAIQEAYDDFLDANYKNTEDSTREGVAFLYLFRTTLPGQVTRANGQVFGSNQVRWHMAFQDEFQFHDYTLFAESRVRQVNGLALLALLVLTALPVIGIVSFCRRYRLVVRLARRTGWYRG